MRAITPPPVFVQMHEAPEILAEGSLMAFTLWVGPIPIYWEAKIENMTAEGFNDRQQKGPFKFWNHRHTFVAAGSGLTEVLDQIELQLSSNPLLWLIGWLMWLNLPILFAYRGWVTKRLLKNSYRADAV
jgi:ligand-binding SRPBCC domain-containing protein